MGTGQVWAQVCGLSEFLTVGHIYNAGYIGVGDGFGHFGDQNLQLYK